ncbi:MAG: hypothetical protein KKB50_11820 [Planctomycetes bacterium]|nr:hypothetical protein [Planctomycetota bacterium]
MNTELPCTNPHSTVSPALLKLLALVAVTWPTMAPAQTPDSAGDAALRSDLARLLERGEISEAVARAQAAVQQRPEAPGVRQEYVNLHITLARRWLAQHRYDDCLTALEAVLAVEPQHPTALMLRAEIDAGRARAAQGAVHVEQLLRIELFDAALERIREIRALRSAPDTKLEAEEAAARRGAADDHYLAKNFREAFALYEHLLTLHPDAAADVHSRWALSLALTLAEGDFTQTSDPNSAGRLLARAIDVLRKTEEPIVGQILAGLLNEQAGHLLDAGRAYAEALGLEWQLPPADRRRAAVASLRARAIQHLRHLYERTPTGRRAGAWLIALPHVWKQRRTPHFDVYARNDLIAERLAEALEYHVTRIAEWLGVPLAETWQPRCEFRIHANMDALHAATDTQGVTRAVSHTRVQGGRVLMRKVELFQTDPWLLCSTVPHELTHIVVADAYRDGKLPLALDEGLALQTEPPARRLQFRRLLDSSPGSASALLAKQQISGDLLTFYGRCDALTSLLLERLAANRAPGARQPVAALLHLAGRGCPPQWWTTFGWESEAASEVAWQEWHKLRRFPVRMPLMILTEPSPEHRTDRTSDREQAHTP